MEKSIWFKRKTYGWGWTPVTVAGWAVTLGYTALVILYPMLAQYGFFPFDQTVFWIIMAVATAGLIGLCWWKGETPRWSWGSPDSK